MKMAKDAARAANNVGQETAEDLAEEDLTAEDLTEEPAENLIAENTTAENPITENAIEDLAEKSGLRRETAASARATALLFAWFPPIMALLALLAFTLFPRPLRL